MSVATILSNWIGRRAEYEQGPAVQSNKSLGTVVEGDFTLDLETGTAYVCDKRLDLTAAEFDLLRFLMAHRKKLVTPGTVVTGAETAADISAPSSIQLLLSLRRKLDAASPARHYLRTEPWILCSFDPIG